MEGWRFWTGEQDQDFGGSLTRSPRDRGLYHYVRFETLGSRPLTEDPPWAVLCLGIVDATTYTEEWAGWASLHMRSRAAAVGLMRLDVECWRRTGHFSGCSPSFMPLPFTQQLPLFQFSVLEQEFWRGLDVNKLGAKPSWIWRINTWSKKGSIKAEWVTKIHLPALKELEIRGNDWRSPDNILSSMPNLTSLDLQSNNLENLPEGMYNAVPNLEILKLPQNNISNYPPVINKFRKLQVLDMSQPLSSVTLRISEEDMEDLPKTLQRVDFQEVKLDANVTNMLLLPEIQHLNLKGCALKYIEDSHLGNEMSSKLEIIDLSSNGLATLPVALFTKMPLLKKLMLSSNHIEMWPKDILVENMLTELYLSNNRIARITSRAFTHLQNLEILDLSWNIIEHISAAAFNNTSHLKKVDLSHNRMATIPDSLFRFSPNIDDINLSNNVLKYAPNLWTLKLQKLDLSSNRLIEFKTNDMSAIKNADLTFNNIQIFHFRNVETLNISYNSLSYISREMWKNLNQLKEVDMGGNDFDCCLFGNDIFLNEEYSTEIWNLGDKDHLTCSVNESVHKIFLKLYVYNETECSMHETKEYTSVFALTVILPSAIIVVAAVLIAVMIYMYRFELMYIRHLFGMKKAGRATDEHRYKTCIYDAFVCYSARNFEWVVNGLLPTLESGPEGYRLCVHDRDFALGAAINRNIVASLEKSRKVIIVLSPDFIASKWCQWELEMANHKMFEEKRNFIILVELERLERRALPRHLRYLMDRTTYLQWPSETQEQERRAQTCFRRLRRALGESLCQRVGRPLSGSFTVLDSPADTYL